MLAGYGQWPGLLANSSSLFRRKMHTCLFTMVSGHICGFLVLLQPQDTLNQGNNKSTARFAPPDCPLQTPLPLEMPWVRMVAALGLGYKMCRLCPGEVLPFFFSSDQNTATFSTFDRLDNDLDLCNGFLDLQLSTISLNSSLVIRIYLIAILDIINTHTHTPHLDTLDTQTRHTIQQTLST